MRRALHSATAAVNIRHFEAQMVLSASRSFIEESVKRAVGAKRCQQFQFRVAGLHERDAHPVFRKIERGADSGFAEHSAIVRQRVVDGEHREADMVEAAKHQSGMLSCFFHGFCNVLPRSLRRPSAMRRRVECGMITSSMKPCEAATNGLAKRAS